MPPGEVERGMPEDAAQAMGGMEALRLPPTSPTRALPVQARATVSSQRQGSADTQRPMRLGRSRSPNLF